MDDGWDFSAKQSELLATYSKKAPPQWVMWLKVSEPLYLDQLVNVAAELELLLERTQNQSEPPEVQLSRSQGLDKVLAKILALLKEEARSGEH